MALDPARLRLLNPLPPRPGRYVLYWMTANRRRRYNHALQHAVARARELGAPLLVLEGLRLQYPHASDRHHRFVLDGMADNARAFADSAVTYLPWVESRPGEGKGLLARLAQDAALLVTDDWPGFFHPRMLAAAARLPIRMEAVDSAGLLPVRAADKAYGRAVDFRRFLQKTLPTHLAHLPQADPLAGVDLPPATVPAWLRPASAERLAGRVEDLPIDHSVSPVAERGGSVAGRVRLDRFLDRLPSYLERNQPDGGGGSGLSPYLHYGQVGAGEVYAALLDRVGPPTFGKVNASREGWWGLPEAAESFLDELITWRELALNGAAFLPGYESYEATPAWAQQSLEEHRADPRPALYSLEELDAGLTHDPLWNAAQAELRESGRMHNYLRMLWGKRVLEWSEDPRRAFEILVHLNDRYALDGRDPNTLAGVGWVFGRYDRPWGPRRPIFGTVRYMSSENTARKLRLREYLERWG